jgi:hypothetical protein
VRRMSLSAASSPLWRVCSCSAASSPATRSVVDQKQMLPPGGYGGELLTCDPAQRRGEWYLLGRVKYGARRANLLKRADPRASVFRAMAALRICSHCRRGDR